MMTTNAHPNHRFAVGRACAAALLVLVGVIGFAGAASAGDNGDYVGNTTVVSSVPEPPKAVAATESVQAPAAAVAAEAVVAPAPKSESLAFTGSDALRLAIVGGALVVAGGAALMLVRRQRSAA
jgi:uncharacterized membrane protein YphA (DoxX/SURF4 family)